MASMADMLAPSLQLGATIFSAGSQLARGQAARTIGGRRKASSEFEAQQLEQNAAQVRSAGLRAGMDEQLKAELVQSTALARAAASGAGASDPTVLQIIARTAGEGEYRRALAMYEGEAQARSNLIKAAAARMEGDIAEDDSEAAEKMANLSTLSTVLTGGAQALSMFDKYWAGPKGGLG